MGCDGLTLRIRSVLTVRVWCFIHDRPRQQWLRLFGSAAGIVGSQGTPSLRCESVPSISVTAVSVNGVCRGFMILLGVGWLVVCAYGSPRILEIVEPVRG